MDCSSPYAMAGLIGLKDRFDVAFGNDADSDRHGIVTPERGPHEPEPLPRGGDRVPLPAPARLARRRGGRQDARLELDDRPRGARPRPPARRGAGRLQVVRRRPPRRLARLRRRGERRRVVPAHATAPSGRPTRTASSSTCSPPRSRAVDRQGPRRALPRARGPLRRARLRAHRRAGDARAEGGAREAVAGARSTADDARRRADRREADATRPATARRSAGSRSSTENGWFAARPSGTEDVYKIYAESFRGPEHLTRIQDEARAIVGAAARRLRRAPAWFAGGQS